MSEASDGIQKRMEELRGHLAEDVEDVIRSTKQMADWQEYVTRYPWLCMGAAAAIGYLVVPKRVEIVSPDTETLLELAKRNKLVVKADPAPQKRGSLAGMLFTFAANAAIRAAMAHLGQRGGKHAE